MTDAIDIGADGVRLGAPDGRTVFSNSFKLLTGLERYTGTHNIPARAQGALFSGITTVDHPLALDVTPGADRINGWIQVTSVNDLAVQNKPLNFSGSVMINGAYFADGPSNSSFLYQLQSLSPRVVGTTLYIREQYFNWSIINNPNRALPAISLTYDISVAKFLGG